jgi:hypothetical protein
MKTLKFVLVALLIFAVTPVVSIPTSAHSGLAQTQASTALERGYRTGYSDGYDSGFKDKTDRATRDYRSKDAYQRADRSYVDVWGPIEDYRDGYQQGFEAGYDSGYDRKPFESSLPAGFKKRGPESQPSTQNSSDPVTPADPTQSSPANGQASPAPRSADLSGSIRIPSETVLLIELQRPLSTDVSQRGDPFEARVIEPREYEGAIVHGRITRLQRPGKVKGAAEMQLTFDEIRLPDNRTTQIHAEVVEVIDAGGNGSVSEVDREGGVKGKSSTKNDVAKVGAATGVGAIIGAIVGGGKGAAIGAAIGAGVGTGGVLSSPGKDIRLEQGQRLRIRTSTEISIQ